VAEADLIIRIKRHSDGSASLTCTRRDGSTTWQRQSGSLGMVFPPHDLTHYAVETTLGYRGAFYGLIADGWEISDFAKPWARGPIPAEAREVETIVSVFESVARRVQSPTTADVNGWADEYVASRNAAKPGSADWPRMLSGDEIERVVRTRAGLLERWSLLAPGDALELEFVRGSQG
jgi:hypothetical protein